MRTTIALLIAVLALAVGGSATGQTAPVAKAQKELIKVGSNAPNFVAVGHLNGLGRSMTFYDELKTGPVVLFFCGPRNCTPFTVEYANSFAEFKKAGVNVIGVLSGMGNSLSEFSTLNAKGRFKVVDGEGQLVESFGAGVPGRKGQGRPVSMIVTSNGRVAFVHDNMDYTTHVSATLAAAKALPKTQ